MLHFEKPNAYRKPTALFLAVLMMVSALSYSTPARAEVSDRKAFLLMAFYGVLAGATMGLIATPLTRNPRSIWLGTSIGLYLGSIGSLYHFSHRDDPGNPLSSQNPDFGQAGQRYSPVLVFSIPVATF